MLGHQARGCFSESTSGREGDGYSRASSFSAGNGDISAMRGSDALDYGKAKASAARFTGPAGIHAVEALLHVWQMAFGNTRPIIGDGYG